MSMGTQELDNASLAQLLRECATIVETDGTQTDASSSVLLYKALEALHLYTEKNSTVNPLSGQTRPNATATIFTRPSFQRPTNKTSNLIANGWVLQQRRSKLRVVWKEVLASLVEARRPGEETTLWIQRESVDTTSVGSQKGKMVLQALHQIPMKWLLDVKLLDFYGDYRFSVKVFNVPEDFVFRTADEESCKEWVATLKSARDARGATGSVSNGSSGGAPHGTSTGNGSSSAAAPSSNGSSATEFPDLLGNDKKGSGDASETSHTNGHVFPDLNLETGDPAPSAPPFSDSDRQSSAGSSSNNAQQGPSSPKKERKSIKELRAIAHAEGYDTRGMERSDLEKIAAYFAPVSEKNEMYRRQQQQQQQQQNTHRPQNGANQSAEAAMNEKRMAAEAERIRKHQEEERIKQQQEYVKKKLEEAKIREEEIKKHTEAAKKREQEQKLRKEQQRRQQQQQQQQWQNQHRPQNWNNARPSNSNGAGTPRHRPTANNPNIFESSRFFDNTVPTGESGPRRKFPNGGVAGPRRTQPDPPSNSTHASPIPPQQPPQAQYYPQHGAFNNQTPRPQQPQQQQHPAHHAAHSAPPPPPSSAPPQQNNFNSQPPHSDNNRSSDPTSPLNQKYAKVMANNQEGDGSGDDQAAITTIKRNILISWALVPPQYNMLRPIDQLLTTIQNVLPPFGNVAQHEYFSKWKVIERNDLFLSSAMGNQPDEAKLKKAVRKLRVLLHPDRLPREFDQKQNFVCKMLWDVSNDAYEEFLKQKDDLDWIHK